MTIELWWLFAAAVAYLGLLFLIAYAADAGWLPRRVVAHPLTYTLSLGVYATSWTYYGSVGFAERSGYVFLTIYLGVTAAFLLGPYLLKPLLRLSRQHQLTSIADLLAFRYGGRSTGLVVTLFMMVGILPYLSLQIRAVTESVQVLSRTVPNNWLALSFCILITSFAILFGARHLTPREKHSGLVVAIAFESAVKLIALLIAGLFVVTEVFDSPLDMTTWAKAQPDTLTNLHAPVNSGMWSTLLLLAFCAAFLLPRQFHMTFVENHEPRHLHTAYWLFPLYLLLLNLPIVPILFAGQHLSLSMQPDFYVLGIAMTFGHQWLAYLVFLGGLSAASAMVIVTTLALSSMCLNHLLLPASLAGGQPTDLYQRLLWSKRIIIGLIIAAAYGFYIVIELNEGLASQGLISFVAAAQLLPGVLGLLFWQRGTRLGFLAGLSGGAFVWFMLLIWPLLEPATTLFQPIKELSDIWTVSTFCSLSVNTTAFVLGSLFSQPSSEEHTASRLAVSEVSVTSDSYRSRSMTARSATHYLYAMQGALGKEVGQQEMQRALAETGIDFNDKRSAELQLLHERLESNLTGLIGPTLARDVLRQNRPAPPGTTATHELADARLLELRLETSREQMRGMTRELDDLRRYLRSVLHDLPVGVCSIARDGTIYLWNFSMQSITGIAESQARDHPLSSLPAPWNKVLQDFALSAEHRLVRCQVELGERTASINLQKSAVDAPRLPMQNNEPATLDVNDHAAGQVILLEDRTTLDTLEAELAHSERLASIGRLAAGVAHEIGNPLTGIASVAQNLRHELNTLDNIEASQTVGSSTNDIMDQVDRINAIVRSLLSFSHAESTVAAPFLPVSVASSIDSAMQLVGFSQASRDVQFVIEIPDDAQVAGDANQLVQVFVNLINNACDATPAGTEVQVIGQIKGNWLEVTVCDQGPGISASDRERIFEPFFTTKAVGHGTGLGLSLVYNIVQRHGGRIRVDDSTDSGTCMRVTLPTYDAQTTAVVANA